MAAESDDHAFMGEALKEAERALDTQEVPVGCVFVHPSEGVMGRGHNNTVASCNGTRHAELEAIDKMLDDGRTEQQIAECSLYVTVEPCIMCASALRQLRVRRVLFGCGNDKFGGCGVPPPPCQASARRRHAKSRCPTNPNPAAHRSPLAGSVLSIHTDDLGEQPPLPSTGGLRAEEAVAMLRLFYAQENQNAPEPQKRTKKQLVLAQQAGSLVGRGADMAAQIADQRTPPGGAGPDDAMP